MLGTTLVGYLQGKQVLHPNHKTVGSFEPDAFLLLASVAFNLWKLSSSVAWSLHSSYFSEGESGRNFCYFYLGAARLDNSQIGSLLYY